MHSRQDVHFLTSDCSLVAWLPSASITLHQKPQTRKTSFLLLFVVPLNSKSVFRALSHATFLMELKFYHSYFVFITKTHIWIEI